MPKLTSSLLLFAGLVGCAAQSTALAPPPASVAKKSVAAPVLVEEAAPAVLERRIGDYVVHMISGTFRTQPATFTERVVGRKDGYWIVELVVEDTAGRKTLRAWIDDNGGVGKVSVLSGEGEEPAELADYEALIASVSVIPDENEGLTASTRGTCLVGPSELDCETKSYRVRLGERDASLGITHSPSLPGSDIGGEITLADGTVIFRSQLLESGNDTRAVDPSFALLADEPSGAAK